MTKNTKIIISIVILIFIIWLGYSYSQKQKSGEAIKIGVSLPLSGAVAASGEWALNGMRLATDEINNSGGVDGRKIDLIIEDDKCNAKEGVNVVNKLLNDSSIKSLIIYCGAVTEAIAGIINSRALTYVISVRTESLEGKYPFLFNMAPAPEKEARILAQYAYNGGIRKIAIIRQADFFGETYKNKFKKAFTDLGGQIVIDSFLDNAAVPDFRTDLTKAKSLGAEGIFTSFNTSQYATIIKQANQFGMNIRFFSLWNTENKALLSAVGDLANGIVYTYTFRENANPDKYQAFKEAYISRYNIPPEANSANGYDSIFLITNAVKKCGDKVKCLIDETSKISNYSGVSGTITFENNVADKEIYLKTVKNGQFVPYGE